MKPCKTGDQPYSDASHNSKCSLPKCNSLQLGTTYSGKELYAQSQCTTLEGMFTFPKCNPMPVRVRQLKLNTF